MAISKLDIMKLCEEYDSEVDVSDFTPDELEELFDRLQQSDTPMTAADFKRKYFEFYDDVKDKSLKKQDW